MKKIVLLLAVVVMSVSAWALPETSVSQKAVNAFKTQFKNATNALWVKNYEGLYLVSFSLNDQKVKAYYNEEGQMEALQRTVTVEQMSTLAAGALQQLSTEINVTVIAEINQIHQLYYLVKGENEKHIVTYKIYTDGSTEKVSKKKK
jgi:hypothetical protein